jgi:hypothetical protein
MTDWEVMAAFEECRRSTKSARNNERIANICTLPFTINVRCFAAKMITNLVADDRVRVGQIEQIDLSLSLYVDSVVEPCVRRLFCV